ncbi:MAG: hypothetical protein HC797_06210 [Anaerolineales bacterium]|nr:hypothetical protein [Anaerolineales bacterium]
MFDIAAARAYYSAFYAAKCFVVECKDLITGKHSGVIALIHQHFVKTGKLSKEGRQEFKLVV